MKLADLSDGSSGQSVTCVHGALVNGPRTCSCQTSGISLAWAAQSVSDVRVL